MTLACYLVGVVGPVSTRMGKVSVNAMISMCLRPMALASIQQSPLLLLLQKLEVIKEIVVKTRNFYNFVTDFTALTLNCRRLHSTGCPFDNLCPNRPCKWSCVSW